MNTPELDTTNTQELDTTNTPELDVTTPMDTQELDATKYDRQIRLFGTETQRKLCNMKIQMIGSANITSSEIIKNIVLLGVGKIIVTERMLKEIGRLIPDPIEAINENLKIKISEEIEDSDFTFIVGECEECQRSRNNSAVVNTNGVDQSTGVNSELKELTVSSGNRYSVCCNCYSLEYNSDKILDYNNEKENSILNIAKECFIGAFAVQEFLKIIQQKDFVKKFKFQY